ncbi:Hmg Domain-Containing Protein 4 [Manis pentadactyla]|nr:Hmg Domain-Containing Protein 4 [Manis pentadactyla]
MCQASRQRSASPRAQRGPFNRYAHGRGRLVRSEVRGRARAGTEAGSACAHRARGRSVGFPEAAGRGRRAHPDGWRRLRGGRRLRRSGRGRGRGRGSGPGTAGPDRASPAHLPAAPAERPERHPLPERRRGGRGGGVRARQAGRGAEISDSLRPH